MSYPSDLTDEQWELIRPFVEYPNGYGNRRKHPIRDVINAILYLNKTGCQWRNLPKDFPNWKTVHTYYSRLCERGKWEEMLDALNKMSRKKKGRKTSPTLAIVDAQSVKTIAYGESQGYDGGKKVKGRKQSIVVDHESHLLHVHVSAANEHDTVLGCEVLEQVIGKYSTIETICADAGYRGLFVDFAQSVIGIRATIVKKIKRQFKIQPKRWIVERTFAWLNNAKRLAKDVEVNPVHSKNMIRVAMIKLTLNQLTS